MENLENLTVKELRERAIKLGMSKEDAETFTVKAPLLATLKVLETKKVETITPPANPKEEQETEQRWLSKADRMLNLLLKQPRVRFMIPLEPKERPGVVKETMVNGRFKQIHVSGAIETPCINGCKWLVPKGVMVDIPEQVAELLAESYRMTSQAGQNILLDRIDPETGRPVRQALE